MHAYLAGAQVCDLVDHFLVEALDLKLIAVRDTHIEAADVFSLVNLCVLVSDYCQLLLVKSSQFVSAEAFWVVLRNEVSIVITRVEGLIG
jgi:hypothetical protein